MKKISIILSILIILGCFGYIAYDRITDYMVKKTLTMVREDEKLQSEIAAAMKSLEEHMPDKKEGAGEDEPTGEEPSPSKETASVPVDDRGRSAAVFPTAPPKIATSQNDGTLSIDDLEASDKAFVMQIYSRFSASEISTVSGMLSGGLTVEEKRKIKAIVYAKVSSLEMSQLYKIAEKYQ